MSLSPWVKPWPPGASECWTVMLIPYWQSIAQKFPCAFQLYTSALRQISSKYTNPANECERRLFEFIYIWIFHAKKSSVTNILKSIHYFTLSCVRNVEIKRIIWSLINSLKKYYIQIKHYPRRRHRNILVGCEFWTKD